MMSATVVVSALFIGAQVQAGWDADRTKALQLRLDGKTSEAVTILEAAVVRYPTDAGPHYELADALQEQMRVAEGSTTQPAARTARWNRIATLLRRAMTLDPQYRQIAAAKLVSVYEEDDFKQPQEVERLSRDLIRMDPASGVWNIKLAQSVAAQQRCGEAARILVAARKTVDADSRLLLGMSMTELFLECQDMPLADARPLLESADAIAAEALLAAPDDRDVLMMQAAALTALASKLPEGPEKKAVAERGAQVSSRFFDLNPSRQAALRGEVPERVSDGFSYISELTAAGKTQEAEQLFANMKVKHDGSAEFWSSAAYRHQQRGERDQAIAAMQRYLELAPRGPRPQMMLGNMYVVWGLDESATPQQRATDLTTADAAFDAALQAGPDDIGALTGKAEVRRARAALEQDPARKEALMAEFRTWMTRVGAAYKAQQKP